MDTQTIISGAMLSQVVLGVVMFVAAKLIESSQPRTAIFRGDPSSITFASELLFLVLITLAVLVLTEEFSASWLGLFKGSTFTGIPRDISLPVVFISDILITARLVKTTGGSIDSPFQPIFFLIPTLALLLYEPSINVALYSFLVSACFVALLVYARPSHLAHRTAARIAYGFVSIASLALAVTIGLLTRSCPENIC